MNRGGLLAVAWAPFQPRTSALARDLGGEVEFISGRAWLPLRYLSSSIRTWRLLSQRRPDRVPVVTPPVLVPVVAWLRCTLNRRDLIVDCHTGAFDSRKWAWALPIHQFVLRRSRAVLVHTEAALELVGGWAAPVLLLPDDVPDGSEAAPDAITSGATVLVAGSFDENEPVVAALAAAGQLAPIQVAFTGDTGRLAARVRSFAPDNALFTGYLPYSSFLAELRAAQVVAVFSTDPQIMNRAAFEAVGLGLPLVLSDLPGLRKRFGAAALFCCNEPDCMARAIAAALADRRALAEKSRALARELQGQRADSMARLGRLLDAARLPDRLRVLLITQHPYPEHMTVRRNVHHLSEQGFGVDLVCAGKCNERAALPAGVRVFRVPIAHRRTSAARYIFEYLVFFAWSLALSSRLALRHRYVAAQVDNPPDFLVFSAFPARFRGARVVLDMLELGPELTAARLGVGETHRMVRAARWSERIAAAWADQVITVSEPCRRILLRRGLHPAKVAVVPNTAEVTPGSFDAWVPTSDPYLIVLASLIERYGVQVAIRALKVLEPRWPRLTLRVLGDGELKPELVRLAADLGLADRVLFAGFLPWQEAMVQVSRAAIGLVPVIRDGYGELLLPTKLLEYVEHGVPVVASRLPAIEEHFPNGTVTYVEPGDPVDLAAGVDRILRDPARASIQARHAADAISGLRWKAVSARYVAALGLSALASANAVNS